MIFISKIKGIIRGNVREISKRKHRKQSLTFEIPDTRKH